MSKLNFKTPFTFPYKPNKKFNKQVAYFSMEFAIDQALKTYSGGLGFLAGSHMKSAYDLKQNLIGIGVLWRKGYYDQVRQDNNCMGVQFRDKHYDFLQETNIKFTIKINNSNVWVTAYYLSPETFGTAPMFFLSTDLPENDYLAQTTTFHLYDANHNAKIAQTMVLGLGGAKLLDELNIAPDIYHFNEAHALSSVFYLYEKFNDISVLKEKLRFTTHTPEEAGNEKHNIHQLNEMSFFGNIPLEKVREITQTYDDVFNHSLVALRLCKLANGVSKLHGEVSREMWKGYNNLCSIIHITNAQNKKYWADKTLNETINNKDIDGFYNRKKELKKQLFKEVANQCGKLFDENILTIVWARRFAGYKRADLITQDLERFLNIIHNQKYPVQIIFAGKPYPFDFAAIETFNQLVKLSETIKNMAVLTGYELELSAKLKKGADVWLNNPRVTREASGTSGMTAAMNGAINFSTNDGWVREFKDNFKNINAFVLPIINTELPLEIQDTEDRENLYLTLENEIVPLYYKTPKKWFDIVGNSANDVYPFFDSDRMATEYYEKLYK